MKKILKITLTLILAIFTCIHVSACSCSDTDYELTVNTDNAKLVYDLADDFSGDGILVEVKSSSGSVTKIVDYDIDASSFKKGTEGTYEIVVTYSKYKTKYTVNVKEKGTLQITQNDKFFVGQDFESNNPILTHVTSTNIKTQVENYEVISFDTTEVGEHSAQIKANGFEYTVEYEVVENLDYLQNLIENVWLQTKEEDVYAFMYGYYDGEHGKEPSESYETIISEDGLIYCVGVGQFVGWYYVDWIETDGTVTKYRHGLCDIDGYTQEKYSSQEEALQKHYPGGLDTYGSPYSEYMYLVNFAQYGVNNGTIDKIQKVENGNQIEITISAVDESGTVTYKVFYNAETELIETVEAYIESCLTNMYKFNYTRNIPPIPEVYE